MGLAGPDSLIVPEATIIPEAKRSKSNVLTKLNRDVQRPTNSVPKLNMHDYFRPEMCKSLHIPKFLVGWTKWKTGNPGPALGIWFASLEGFSYQVGGVPNGRQKNGIQALFS